jgi:hypothetical protein
VTCRHPRQGCWLADSLAMSSPYLPSLYKARKVPTKQPVCAICVDRTRGKTQRVGFGYGVEVWLCEGHASVGFLTQRGGRDVVLTLRRCVAGEWVFDGCSAAGDGCASGGVAGASGSQKTRLVRVAEDAVACGARLRPGRTHSHRSQAHPRSDVYERRAAQPAHHPALAPRTPLGAATAPGYDGGTVTGGAELKSR